MSGSERGGDGGLGTEAEVNAPNAPAPPERRGVWRFLTPYQLVVVGLGVAMLGMLYYSMDPIIECSELQAEYEAGNVQKAFAGYERLSGSRGYEPIPSGSAILTGSVAE